jgi:hypothetical protein
MKRIATVVLSLAALALPTMIPGEALGSCRSHACWQRVHVHRVVHSVEKKIARVAPYRCYGDRFAIPCYYIGRESATSGLWRARNSNGCIGAYQFCGWRVPWPVIVASRYETLKRKLAHDRMARILWGQQVAGRACHWCY